jgi:peptidoglycan/LPS O-acetylase OafA/YrhL
MARIFPTRDTPIDYLMVLRGCAVIGVLLGHVFGIGTFSIGAVVTKGPYNYVPHAEPFDNWRTAVECLTPLIGQNFVILFFVQSGYLMGKVFFEGRYDARTGKRAFYWARYLRLAPLLYFNLIICLAFYRHADLSPIKLLGEFLFINNFTGFGLNNVTWSLSYELQYYLIAPFIFLAFRRADGKAVAGCLVLVTVAFWIGRSVPFLAFTYAFLLGFAVNLMPKRPTSVLAKRLALVFGLLVLHLGYNVLQFIKETELAGLLAVLVSACMVYMCERPADEKKTKKTSPLILRVGEMTGYLTYGIYLWHYPMIMTRSSDFHVLTQGIAKANDLPLWQTVLLYQGMMLIYVLVVSYVLAYTTFVLIEARFRPSLYSGLPK